MKKILYSIILVLTFYASSSIANTFLYFNSEQGDYIGYGKEQTWTPDDGIFSVTKNGYSNAIDVTFNGNPYWSLDFAPANNEEIKVGAYENATRYPFQSPTKPGLSISGDGRGCNTLTGRFDILELSYTENGDIESFSADFEQHCEGGSAALFGSIRYNASIGFPVMVDIKANGQNTPLTIVAGNPVEISVSVKAGDDKNINAEYWLGRSGTYGSQWFNGKKWKASKKRAKVWKNQPIDTETHIFTWTPKAAGIYMFQFILDRDINKKPNTFHTDHVVITVVEGSF